MVTLVVGAKSVVFTVHRDLIREASSFFEAAFKSVASFKGSTEHSISLPEDDTETIDIFVTWLYGYVVFVPLVVAIVMLPRSQDWLILDLWMILLTRQFINRKRLGNPPRINSWKKDWGYRTAGYICRQVRYCEHTK